MLFILNSLAINGGTTFVLRFCKEFLRIKNIKVQIIILDNPVDSSILRELQNVAEIYFLSDILRIKGFKKLKKINIYTPLDLDALGAILSKASGNVHVMGIFGALFAIRLLSLGYLFKLTLGIYHQNEFVFKKVPFYFAKYIHEWFRRIPGDSIIFFGETCVDSYEKFFKRKFEGSLLVPIGIEPQIDILGNYGSKRIITVANLHKFKTYIKSTILLLSDIRRKIPNISYEIYGEGDELNNLKSLICEHGLESNVALKGGVPYESLRDVFKDGTIFIGGGTAILEAAECGLPSIVGIESVEEPITYGYLHQVNGFSYNEYKDNIQTFLTQELIEKLLSSPELWKEESRLCKEKAKEFSITTTVKGFEKQFEKIQCLNKEEVSDFNFTRGTFSIFVCMLFDVLGLDREFRFRRDQGFLNE